MGYVKYHNRKINSADGRFDSLKEYQRWCYLQTLQEKGKIYELRRQVKYELLPRLIDPEGKVIRSTNYFADFTYRTDKGEFVVEDVKGFKTDVYKLKKKLLYEKYKIWIKEV